MAKAFQCDICEKAVKGEPHRYFTSSTTKNLLDLDIRVMIQRKNNASTDVCVDCMKSLVKVFLETDLEVMKNKEVELLKLQNFKRNFIGILKISEE